MNTEDDEFNRIEMESRVRMMAVKYALEQHKQRVTQEELDALLSDSKLD